MKKLIALTIAAALLFLCGCSGAPVETESTTVPTEATLPPETTIAPTEAPSDPPVELHSGLREDGSFDSGTLFIGDSLTYGLIYSYLKPNNLIGDARYMAVVGAPILEFFQGSSLNSSRTCIYSAEFEGLTYSQAVETVGEDVTAVYFMLGSNYSTGTNAQTYIQIVDFLLEKCSNATVYLQLIPYATSTNVHSETVYWSILEAYGHYSMQGISNVILLDIKRAAGVNLTPDGVHLTYEGQENWYNEMVAHAESNNIPQ